MNQMDQTIQTEDKTKKQTLNKNFFNEDNKFYMIYQILDQNKIILKRNFIN